MAGFALLTCQPAVQGVGGVTFHPCASGTVLAVLVLPGEPSGTVVAARTSHMAEHTLARAARARGAERAGRRRDGVISPNPEGRSESPIRHVLRAKGCA